VLHTYLATKTNPLLPCGFACPQDLQCQSALSAADRPPTPPRIIASPPLIIITITLLAPRQPPSFIRVIIITGQLF
jgi:hypothetical protein